MLRLFATAGRRLAALVNVGCCYNRLSEAGETAEVPEVAGAAGEANKEVAEGAAAAGAAVGGVGHSRGAREPKGFPMSRWGPWPHRGDTTQR